MKKHLLIVFIILQFSFVYSQVGIGTLTPNAALDITSATNGLLIPRIALTAKNVAAPVVNPQGGLLTNSTLIYNTASAGSSPNNVVPGFYSWDTTTNSWKSISSTPSNAWDLIGNAGTNSTINFIGTIDNSDLIFKRFNVRAGFLGVNSTSFGTNALNPLSTGVNNTAFGFSSLLNNTIGFANVAVGGNALLSNIGGNDNTGIGVLALGLNTNGSYNTASGSNALTMNKLGSNNVAIGYQSMFINDSGNFNAAIGALSLRNNSLGINNVALGSSSLYNNIAGNSNIAIGYQAGYNELGSNKLYIENSNADAINALVYGEFDTNIFRINGGLQIGNPAGTGYNFPLARGTNGQVLLTDASGNVTWQTPSAGGSGWSLTGNSGTIPTTNFLGTTDNQDLVFKRFNVKSGYLGTSNTSFGVNGLSLITTGLLNTATGYQSLYNTTFGSNNTATGAYSLTSNNAGFGNTAQGTYSLWFNSSGNYNTSIGLNSMRFNDIGAGNTAIGVEALYTNSFGNYNTSIGMNSLHNNVAGSSNVAIGNNAGYLETGSNKLYIENSNANAINALVYGEFDTNIFRINGNIQIGNPAGTGYNFPLSRGTNGQILQTDALGNVTWQTPATGGSGWSLTGNAGTTPATNFIGTTDLQDVVFKRGNVISGLLGGNNTAFGISTFSSASFTGVGNTALGGSALFFNTSGGHNTATGLAAMYSNLTGSYNVGEGDSALNKMTDGLQNTAVGTNALYNLSTGSQNTGIGSNALANLGASCFNNTAIGFNAQVPNNLLGSNQVRIGDTNITYAGIQVAWTITSDKRWKSDIKDMNLGLNFISKLRPVSYFRNNDKAKSIEFGLIAQELEVTLNEFNVENAGILSKDDAGYYGVRYNDLFAPMIKSIQELNAENKELKSKNEELEKRLKAIEEKLN